MSIHEGFYSNYKLCPRCSFFCGESESDKYCSLCGTFLIIECPGCHTKFDNPYAKFCKQCGKMTRPELKEQNKLITF